MTITEVLPLPYNPPFFQTDLSITDSSSSFSMPLQVYHRCCHTDIDIPPEAPINSPAPTPPPVMDPSSSD